LTKVKNIISLMKKNKKAVMVKKKTNDNLYKKLFFCNYGI